MITSLLRSLAARWPRPIKWLRWLWNRFDGAKPWKLRRSRRAIHAARDARSRHRTPREVVFVSDVPRHREAKTAAGLKSQGWRVLLLSRQPPTPDARAVYDHCEQYSDAWDALQKASRWTPVVYHVFTTWIYDTGAVFVRYRPGKVIIDTMDCLEGLTRPQLLRDHYPGQTELERYCLENADGLCCRSLETQFLKRQRGYRFRGRRIFFTDFSSVLKDREESVPKLPGIHVVHIGTMAVEKQEPTLTVVHFLDLARRLARDGIHFHLYGGSRAPGKFEELYAEYLELEKTTEYFHLHREVPLRQLISELRGYTFGMHIAGSLLHFRDAHADSLRPRFDHYTASRVFDQLIAGLPVILHEGRFLSWLTSRLGAAHLVDEGFLREPARWLQARVPGAAERAKLEEAWRSIDCTRHAPRLIRFYEALSAAGGQIRIDEKSPGK